MQAPKKLDTSLFPTWDELVAEANVDIPPYQLPLPEITGPDGEVVQEAEVIEIPVPDGGKYVAISMAEARGDAAAILLELFPDNATRTRVVRALRGAHFPIVGVISRKVLRHFYGMPIVDRELTEEGAEQAEEEAGKSDAV